MQLPFPRIKVCGVTRLADLHSLASAGVDAVGFNLVPSSSRYIAESQAKAFAVQAKTLGLLTVAVVMNPAAEALRSLADAVPFDVLQLHGQEPPTLLTEAGITTPIIKALSWSGRQQETLLAKSWKDHSQLVAFLVDAYAPEHGGGTGKMAQWDLLQPRPNDLGNVPMILAGGLKPENVADAIRTTHADGVDVASGVESFPGIKDADRVAKFALHARQAWQTSKTH